MTDIKQKLIEEIEKIQDNIIIEQLTELIKYSDQNKEVEFSEDQLKSIKESQDQIENGEFYTHEEVMKSINND